MTAQDTTTIMGLFPYPTIMATHATGMEPMYNTLQASLIQLNTNAMSVSSRGGDGILGHLCLTVGSAGYQQHSQNNVAYVPPPIPANAPDFPANATAAVILEGKLQVNNARRAYHMYHAVDATLKQQLLRASDEHYVLSLQHQTHGFALICTRAIIEHLMAAYGNITSEDLAANDKRMQQRWAVTTPIEMLYAQIDDGASYALDGNSAYTDKQLVMYGYNIINVKSIMSLGCRDWRLKEAAADKTWNNLKVHFKAAHADLCTTSTTSTAGFQGHANHTATDSEEPRCHDRT